MSGYSIGGKESGSDTAELHESVFTTVRGELGVSFRVASSSTGLNNSLHSVLERLWFGRRLSSFRFYSCTEC